MHLYLNIKLGCS